MGDRIRQEVQEALYVPGSPVMPFSRSPRVSARMSGVARMLSQPGSQPGDVPTPQPGSLSFEPRAMVPSASASVLPPKSLNEPSEPPPLLSPQMVDPITVEHQRKAFAAQLAAKLKQASQDIARQVQLEKQELAQRAALEKKNYDVNMDQFVQQEALAMDFQTNMDIMQLQKAVVNEKTRLEEQALVMKMDYETKKAEEDMLRRRYEIEKQFLEQNVPLAAAAQELQTSIATHGFVPRSKLPQEPVAPDISAVPNVLDAWWKAYGYAAPSLAVPMIQ